VVASSRPLRRGRAVGTCIEVDGRASERHLHVLTGDVL
jgi:hypothetical protein